MGLYLAALAIKHRVRLQESGDVCLARDTFEFVDAGGDDSDVEVGMAATAPTPLVDGLGPRRAKTLLLPQLRENELPTEVLLLVDVLVMLMGRLGVSVEAVCRRIRDRAWPVIEV
jgi:hypothetical protein